MDLDELEPSGYGASHGLVRGDISSKSISPGMPALAYGLWIFWKTMFAGAECGAEGTICCGKNAWWLLECVF